MEEGEGGGGAAGGKVVARHETKSVKPKRQNETKNDGGGEVGGRTEHCWVQRTAVWVSVCFVTRSAAWEGGAHACQVQSTAKRGAIWVFCFVFVNVITISMFLHVCRLFFRSHLLAYLKYEAVLEADGLVSWVLAAIWRP